MQKERIWQLVSKKLAGEATPAELQELEELLRQFPEMHYAIQHIYDLWQLQPLPAPETEDAFRKHLNKMAGKEVDISPWIPALPPYPQPSEPKRYVRRFIAPALALAATIICIVVLLNRPPKQAAIASKNISEISTRNGSRTMINLPDGSVVWLNAGSKLLYDRDFDSELREVTLTGEAYFDVVKNPNKPFIIHAGKMDIKVLGTLFNVKSYPGENISEASLIRGSIEVMIKDRPTEKIILRPNEKIVVANEPGIQVPGNDTGRRENNEPIVAISHLTYEPKDSTIIETSWVENKFIFRDEAFRELAVRLERWYGVHIRFDNENVQQLRFTGTFRHENIQQALAALKITGGFNYSINDDNVLIY
ncbi:MAG TPA: FecR domain-containing protein [Chitinophagaceae bacterium]|nr:FecR domain-containing protein [Chitinophagaceae bacterium]